MAALVDDDPNHAQPWVLHFKAGENHIYLRQREPGTTLDALVFTRALTSVPLLTLHLNATDLPEVNGQPIDLNPPQTYSGPWLTGDWGHDLISYHRDNFWETLDFSAVKQVLVCPE